MRALIDQIRSLKKERHAAILVHNYQRPESLRFARNLATLAKLEPQRPAGFQSVSRGANG